MEEASSSSQICPLVCSGHPREQPHGLASLLPALWCPQNLPRVGHFSYPLFPSPSLEDRASRPAHFLVKNPLRCSAKCMVRNSGVLRTHRSASGHFLGFCFCLWSCAGKVFSPFHMSKTRYLVFEPGHSLDTFYQRLLLVIFVDKLCLSLSLTTSSLDLDVILWVCLDQGGARRECQRDFRHQDSCWRALWRVNRLHYQLVKKLTGSKSLRHFCL